MTGVQTCALPISLPRPRDAVALRETPAFARLYSHVWHSLGEEFRRSGFRGALNYYRNIDRNWEITGAMAGLQVTVPALYLAGDRDFVVSFPGTDQLLANMKTFVPGLRKIQMLPGCGHWTQQERPNEVNAALVEFIRALPSRS